MENLSLSNLSDERRPSESCALDQHDEDLKLLWNWGNLIVKREAAIETFLKCAEKRGDKVYNLSDPVEAMAYRQEIRRARLEREAKQQEAFKCVKCGGGDFTCTCGT